MRKLILPLILLLFILTRVYQISSVPPSLYWDEASIGYNAYSILKTGKDEWGKSFPIHFRAFGEFKLPVYIYSVVAFESILGLNEWAVRLPSVLFFLGVLILTYLLAKEATQNTKIALFSTFFLTISPWMFIFSRTGYEVSSGLMFYLLSIYFFIRAQFRKHYLFLASISLILSIYSYNSFRILAPLTFVYFAFFYIRNRLTQKLLVTYLLVLCIFVLSLVPIIRLLIYDAGFGRVQSFSLLPTIKQVYDLSGKPHLQLIFDRSKSIDWSKNLTTIATNYLSHFGPDFLLAKGDPNLRNRVPNYAALYLLDPILIGLGVYLLIKKRNPKLIFLLFFILIGPIPAILFNETPHSLRALSTIPFIAILAGIGADYLSMVAKWVTLIMIVVYLVLFGLFFSNFINKYSQQASKEWQYGYKELFLDNRLSSHDNVMISDEYGQPYIFGLFYLKYDPKEFTKTVVRNDVNNWGFSTVASFGKFKFGKTDKMIDGLPAHSLIYATSPEQSPKLQHIDQLKFLDGQTAFWVYQIK